jgi:hypothetical protein
MTKPIDGRIERRVGGSAARNAAILARLDAGATMQAIAEEFGITRQRVSQIAFRVTGQHTRGPRWTAERIAELQCLRREGLSASAIGERMGRTRSAVLSAAHRLNLPPLSNRNLPSNGRRTASHCCAGCGANAQGRAKSRGN